MLESLALRNISVKFEISTVAFEASWYLVLFYLPHLITATLQHEYCLSRSVSV